MGKLVSGVNDLATVKPDLTVEWHPTKNDDLTPEQFTTGSGKKVWWQCSIGHEWEASINHRVRGDKCVVCTGITVLEGYNDLITVNPALAEEWHPTKNILTPQQITAKSTHQVWWVGACNHEWETTVNSRSRGRGCPVCSGRKILIGFNDFATVNPALAEEWHPTKNEQLTPQQITTGTHTKIWWLGKCSHEWAALPKDRARGNNCPYCTNRIVLVGFNDLATKNPQLAAEWHPSKNGELTPTQVTAGTHTKVWWLGTCGHEWENKIVGRVTRGTGCPVCANQHILIGVNDLATLNPQLSLEWHPTKNGYLSPHQMGAGSNTKVWWLGKCNHEWEAAVSRRAQGTGCPSCRGNGIQSGFNDLATKNPALAAEWHPTKNGELAPNQVRAGSHSRVWWLGACGHEWISQIKSRTKGRGCAVCTNKKVLAQFNDLATKNPQLAAEWHPTKNGDLTPQQITAGSKVKAWWLGSCGHEWEANVNSRHNGSNCIYCAGKDVLVGFNDLATKNPELAAEWHPTKNGELTANHVRSGSKMKIWWLGSCGHEWDSVIYDRNCGTGCPICSGQQLLRGFNDFATKTPELVNEWHSTKNGELTPEKIFAGSKEKVWWLGSCGHEWEAQVKARSKGSGCVICSGLKVLEGFNDLITRNPQLAAEWHPTKNGKLAPQQVNSGAHAKVWWLGKCGHEWEAAPNSREKGSGCAYCAGKKVLMGFNDLTTKNPQLAAEWHPTKNGDLTPQEVSSGTHTKLWCLGKCGHEWIAPPSTRNVGHGCPVCSGIQIHCGFNDLATKNPQLAAEWHPTKNGQLTPQQVAAGTHTKVWWLGGCGHEWKAAIKSRSIGIGCSKCSKRISKAEQNINNFLVSLGLDVESSNRKILKGKEIDLWVFEKKIGIEFNGLYWHTEIAGKAKTYHYDKWRACKDQDIQLIQIWEDDWTLRSEIIKRTLAHKLGASATDPISRDTFICSITAQQAEEFLNANHLRGYTSGSYYLGIVETGNTRNLQAVMVLNHEQNSDNKSLEIIRYASIANVSEGFSKLLTHAINAYSPESITVIADHCEADEELYVSNDFIAEKELPPDYMYVLRTERKFRSEYPIERFRDDPALIWEEGKTEMELADLNKLARIWDAGKTIYRLFL